MKFRWQRQVIVFVGASLAASAATAVPVLFTFHQTSLNGVLANFIIVPLLGYGATVLGFVGLVVSSFAPPLASPLFFSAGFLTVLANTVTGWFAALPVFRLYSATALDMALFLLWMSCVSYVAAPRLRLWICSVLPIMAIGIHLADTAVVDGKLHITMLSVGQAESILMRLPDGKAVLVDGGGYLQESERDFGERILAPALRTLGVTHLDTVIITHNHPDHLGGIPYLVESFPVRRVLRTASTADGGMLTQRMMTALVRRQITLYDIAAGMTVPLSADIVLEVLSPSLQPNVVNGEQDVNEESLVFRLHYRSISMLFTADAGFVTEQQLLDRKVPLASTILKVGHHGSRYSTSDDFLQQVKPRIALISAGYGNRFGLPADDTLLQLKRYGTDVYRTDCDGSIELVSDGSSVTVVTPFKDRLMKKLTENSHHAMSMSHE
jgi:competence protein ComEC